MHGRVVRRVAVSVCSRKLLPLPGGPFSLCLTSQGRYSDTDMNRDEILAALNAEIDHLTAVRDLMNGNSPAEAPRRPGRPKGLTSKAVSFNPEEFVTKKPRTMSAEGKARVAEAQRKRWAAQKRKPTKKVSKTPVKVIRKSAPVVKKATKPAARRTPKKLSPKKPSLPVQTVKETSAGTE